MDLRNSDGYPIPQNAKLVADWILWNSSLNRDTVKSLLLSQEFPYIEDDCIQYFIAQLRTQREINEEKLERLWQRARSISTIRLLQNGFIKRVLDRLKSFDPITPESH